MERHHQHAHAFLPARPVRPERCNSVSRSCGSSPVNDECEIGSRDRARRRPSQRERGRGRRARRQARASVRPGSIRPRATRREAALHQPRMHPFHEFTRRAEHQRGARLVIAQHVDDGVSTSLGATRWARYSISRAVRCAGWFRCGRRSSGSAAAIASISRGMVAENRACDARRESSRDELEILAEAEIEHLICLVEHDRPQGTEFEPLALDMVAQAGPAYRRRCAPQTPVAAPLPARPCRRRT